MSERTFRPGFKVVTGVVLFLASLAFGAHLLRSKLPPPEANVLAGSTDDFIRAAAQQPVQWRTLQMLPFAEARRLQRPILLLIGSPWSAVAAEFDRSVFTDTSVAQFLNRQFVCVRIDGSMDRPWSTAFLPLTRARDVFTPGFQLWVLTPRGRPVQIVQVDPVAATRPDDVLKRLLRLRALATQIDLSSTDSELAVLQAAEVDALGSAMGGVMPDFIRAVESLDDRRANAPSLVRESHPQALLFLAGMGEFGIAERRLSGDARNSLPDLSFGGVFHQTWRTRPPVINYSKLSVKAAETAYASAVLARLSDAPVFPLFRDSCDRWVRTMQMGRYIAGAEIERPDRAGRSDRYSYPMKVLRTELTGSERAFAQRALGLYVESNPLMVPRLASDEAFQNPGLLRQVMEKLRATRSMDTRVAARDLAEVHNTVVARLTDVRRLRGDPEPDPNLSALMESAAGFLRGDSIVKRPFEGFPSTYVGDHLSFADAMLSDYLTNGRVISLLEGRVVLERCLRAFRFEAPGLLRTMTAGAASRYPMDPGVPEVADTVMESSSARAIRLCFSYGVLFGDQPEGRRMRAFAQAGVERLANLTQGLAAPVAGYLRASLLVRDDAVVVTTGPRASEMADRIVRRMPTRLVAPLVGSVREDLQRRPAGAYVLSGTIVRGPFSEDQVVELLGVRLQPSESR